MTLSEYRRRLAEVEQAINEVIRTGQSYSITGSHSVTNLKLDELKKERARLRRIILRMKGYSIKRVAPDFF